jgi:hypothetical protein
MPVNETWKQRVSRIAERDDRFGRFVKTVDELAAEMLQSEPSVPPYHHNPLLVEPLLADLAELLDRCTASRMRASELEIAAVEQALTREMVEQLSSLQRRANEDESMASMYAQLADEESQAAASFEDPNHEPVTAGLGARARASAGAARNLREVERARSVQARDRLEIMTRHWMSLYARSEQAGSAHNFCERFDRVVAFFLEDLRVAYRKALSIRDGLRIVYGIDHPLPEVAAPRFIDALMMWCRAALTELDRSADEDFTSTVLVPVVFGAPLLLDSRTRRGALVSPAAFNAALQTHAEWADVTFQIPAEFFDHLSFARLRAIALSVSYATQPDELEERRGELVFWMNLQPPPFVAPHGGMYQRPPLAFRNVRAHPDENRLDWISGSAVFNLNPASPGSWTLQIHRGLLDLHRPDVHLRNQEERAPLNVSLHFSVVARAPSAPPPARDRPILVVPIDGEDAP